MGARLREVPVSWRSGSRRFDCIYMCMCVRIYMFICSELIKETGRPPGLIFGMWGYFWPGSDKFEFWKRFHTFDGVMT